MEGSRGLDSDGFVEIVYETVTRGAVRSAAAAIDDPPGREPGERLVRLHDWWESLDGEGRTRAREAMLYAADLAVFSMLCIFDNVKAASHNPAERLVLKVAVDGAERPLVTDDTEELHAIYQAISDEREDDLA
jgi:hypothetical protein